MAAALNTSNLISQALLGLNQSGGRLRIGRRQRAANAPRGRRNSAPPRLPWVSRSAVRSQHKPCHLKADIESILASADVTATIAQETAALAFLRRLLPRELTDEITSSILCANSFASRPANSGLNLSPSGGVLGFQRRGFKTQQKRSGVDGIRGNRGSDGGWLGRWRDMFRVSRDAVVGKEAARHERLSKMLDSEESDAVKGRIGTAFSEGYVAGQSAQLPKPPLDEALRRRKSFINFVFLGFAIYFLVQAMSALKMSGGSLRILLGGEDENLVRPEDVHVTFDDVKGVREAKAEVQEVVEYLSDPDKFSRLGGRLPKGVLLVGPPGTGKTLLARAIAGEAGVPFFHASGSEFDEVLVGQGARRVRDLFANAKERAPSVIFIDEIDSVGAKRVSTSIHPYANQTINQLLAEMDGFEGNSGVIVIGATNRREDLDKALLRPGRFDVQVEVQLPDMKDRTEIFDLYLGKVQCAKDVSSFPLAEITTGFTGADIENMVNTAAIRAAADALDFVPHKYFLDAKDKVKMGPERKNRIPDEETNRNTAYHEAGHTLVAHFTKSALPLDKVTIIPRGNSLGHTGFKMSEVQLLSQTRAQMLASLDVAMGGRVAEELIFGVDNISTGASSDLRNATAIAQAMIHHYGFSDKVGLRFFEGRSDPMMGSESLGPATQEAIDSEIRRLLSESYERAKEILKVHSKEHKRLAEALLKHETLDMDAVKNVIEGKAMETTTS